MDNSIVLTGTGTIVSSTTNGTPNFIPMTQWVGGADVVKVRATLEMRGNSAACQINGAYQTSNDKISVNSPQSILSSPTYLTTEGFQYPSQFNDISTATAQARYVRFGIMAQPSSGATGAVQGCWASITVEIQGT